MQAKNQLQLMFRSRLEALLKERGVSQRQLALAIGVRPQSVNNYLRGVTKLPGAQELLALARYFGVPMEHFLTDQQEKLSARGEAQHPGPTPAVSTAAVRRAAARMRRCAEELRHEAERLERPSDGRALPKGKQLDVGDVGQQPTDR